MDCSVENMAEKCSFSMIFKPDCKKNIIILYFFTNILLLIKPTIYKIYK